MVRLIRKRGCFIIALVLAGLTGCSRSEEEARPTTAVQGQSSATAPVKPVDAQPVSRKRLQKPFKEAVILDPPAGQQCMPVRTSAGKNIANIFEAIAGAKYEGGLWDRVDFFDAQGRPIRYQAVVKTDLGQIHIDLLSDAAPHHVTNFIALARAGYYDGLPFHASRRVVAAKEKFGYLEAGCPKGTGEKGYGSVGYWLEPETDNTLVHDAGSVGTFHEPEQTDTGACRFYITLFPTPGMDRVYTIFGKVTRGLDVVQAINQRPVINEDPFDRPREPVIIRSVAIQVKD